jgi:hypothetical protein
MRVNSNPFVIFDTNALEIEAISWKKKTEKMKIAQKSTNKNTDLTNKTQAHEKERTRAKKVREGKKSDGGVRI